MTRQQILEVVKQFGGWVEGGEAVFPSVRHTQNFLAYMAAKVK